MNPQNPNSNKRNEKRASNKEDSQLDTLFQVGQILGDITDQPYLPSHRLYRAKTNSKPEKVIKCVCCLLPIKKGDILCSTPCCNSLCHINCLKTILTHEEMYHACPICLIKFNSHFKNIVLRS